MKSAIFIDGGYLEKVLKHEFKSIRIDFQKLSTELAGNKEILRTYYYNCLPYQKPSPSDDERRLFSSRQKFYNALERLPRYTVRLGKVAYRGEDAEGNKIYEQKQIDTLLSIDMVQLAALGKISDAILVAGDSDFVPAIKVVKELAVNVILYHSALSNCYHRELWQICDDRIPIDSAIIDRVKLKSFHLL